MTSTKGAGETAAILLGLLAASWLLTSLVFASELVPGVSPALKAIFTHHWIGKVVISYVAFFTVWLGARVGFKNKSLGNINAWKWAAVASLILEILLIAAMFVWLFFAE